MNAQTLRAVVGGIVPVIREYVAQQIRPVTDANAELCAEVRSLRVELETRTALIEPPKEEAEDRSLDEWESWFARDSLTLVREAKELELRAVQDAIQEQRSDSTVQAITSLAASVASLATRDVPPTIVNVSAPTVNVAPSDVKVELTMQPEAGKTVTRHSKVIRGDVGELIGVETTEVKE